MTIPAILSGDFSAAQILAERWEAEVWKPRCIAIQYSQRLGDEGLVMSLMSLYLTFNLHQLIVSKESCLWHPCQLLLVKLLMLKRLTIWPEILLGMASNDMFSAEESRVSRVQNCKYENFKI